MGGREPKSRMVGKRRKWQNSEVSMRNFRKFLCTFAAVLSAAAVFAAADEAYAAETEENTIAEGVFIGSVDVGGMTEKEARNAIEAYVGSLSDLTFTLIGPNGSMEVTAGEMGLNVDASDAIDEALTIAQGGNLINRYKEISDLKKNNIVLDMYMEVDKQTTAQLIYAQTGTLNIEAVDNGLTRDNGSFVFVEGQTGSEVDIVESVYAINDFFAYTWDGTDNEISLVVDEIEPRGTKEELAAVQDLLGSFSTDFSTSADGRKTNVSNGCSKINGTLLYPGDTFSVYDTISPFTEENGYATASAYANGKVVDSIGGGICQVSTTLYNAIIRAELQVTMRYNHSMLVTYVDPSDDAAIASGLKDFQFVNNLEDPVYIEGYCSGGVITMNVYGRETRPSNRKISFESEILSQADPQVSYTLSDEYDAGYWKVMQSEHRGTEARLWKIVTVDGVEESREVFNNSSYRESPKEVTIGTKGGSAEWLAAVQAAIKAGDDEATVKAVVSNVTVAPTEETVPEEEATATETTGDASEASSDDTADKKSKKKDKNKNKKEETAAESTDETTDKTTEESAEDSAQEEVQETTPQETESNPSDEASAETPESASEEASDSNTSAEE
jgi:vancomycin resistance protein YoaR